jgi:glycosyltransferase involved in cell wall biosynthesis/GT2 family glycosyltransferase
MRILIKLIRVLFFSTIKFLHLLPHLKVRHFVTFYKLLSSCFIQEQSNSSFLKFPLNKNNDSFKRLAINKGQSLKQKVKFSIIVPIYKTNLNHLNEMINSVVEQSYQNWELILVDDFSNDKNLSNEIKRIVNVNKKIHYYQMKEKTSIGFCTNFGIKKADGTYIGLLDHDDILDPHTLLLAAIEINKNPNLALIYTDEDKFNGSYYYDFQYKPDFDRELLLTTNYINHFKIFKKNICKKVGFFLEISGVQDYEFLSRYVNQIEDYQVFHIPVICYHWRAHKGSSASSITQKKYMLEQAHNIFQKNINNLGLSAKVFYPNFAQKNKLIYFNLEWKKRSSSKVSIIIPNKNSYKILKSCINSLKKTVKDLNLHQIIIVDDNSVDIETLNYYESLKSDRKINCNILPVNFGEFNFSRMINHGVKKAKNEFLLILNNDITAIKEGWLDQMLGWFEINHVGIIGPKLLFPNQNVQHAGVMVGPHHGLADHFFYNLNKDSTSYLNLLNLQRNVSAVTGACFLTKKSVFETVSGMDDKLFKVSYSDIDFCLRVKEKKFSIIYDNTIELYHLTSASRGSYVNPAEHHNFIKKYKNYRDPYINPNININSTKLDIDFSRFVYSDYSNQKLHLALFTHNFELGGAPLLIFDYAKEFILRGFKVTIVSTKKGPLEQKFKKLKNTQIIIQELDVVSPNKDFEDLVENFFQKLDKVFKKNKPDFIFANTMLSFPAVLYANTRGIYSRWFIHEEYSATEMLVNFNSYKGLNLIQNAFKVASKIIYESSYIFECYKNYSKNNYEVRPGGINFKEIEEFKSTFTLKEKYKLMKNLYIPIKNKVFLTVGTVCERKNQFEIVKAVSQMSENLRKTFSVIIVGDIGLDYSQNIKTYISKHKLSNVHLLPNQNNIYDYYSMADFYISATNSESFPRALLTAMAFELPVISSVYKGIHEVLYDDNYATFYKKNDERNLSERINDFLDNDNSKILHKAGLSLSLIMRIFNLDRVIKYEINSMKKMIYDK